MKPNKPKVNPFEFAFKKPKKLKNNKHDPLRKNKKAYLNTSLTKDY